jgi:hypothetical protein
MIFFWFELCSLVASMLANVSRPQSRGLGHYGGHGTTAAAMVHCVVTTWSLVLCFV